WVTQLYSYRVTIGLRSYREHRQRKNKKSKDQKINNIYGYNHKKIEIKRYICGHNHKGHDRAPLLHPTIKKICRQATYKGSNRDQAVRKIHRVEAASSRAVRCRRRGRPDYFH